MTRNTDEHAGNEDDRNWKGIPKLDMFHEWYIRVRRLDTYI